MESEISGDPVVVSWLLLFMLLFTIWHFPAGLYDSEIEKLQGHSVINGVINFGWAYSEI